jgi:hypothetical protein
MSSLLTVLGPRARPSSACRHARAIDELLTVGERELSIGWTGPSQFAWRSQAALALAALDERGRAQRLVDEELALARRCGAPRALGLALRASALLRPNPDLEGLQESVAVLGRSGCELEHARALVDLGAAMRRARSRRAAGGRRPAPSSGVERARCADPKRASGG